MVVQGENHNNTKKKEERRKTKKKIPYPDTSLLSSLSACVLCFFLLAVLTIPYMCRPFIQ